MRNGPFSYFLDVLPLWGLFLLTVALISFALEVGFRIGTVRRGGHGDEREAALTTVVSATLALLGFMLAMAFGIAISRFDGRRQAFFKEVNALGSAYLRADLLPEAVRSMTRSRLRAYVELRIKVADEGALSEGLVRSTELQRELWALAVDATREASNPVVVSLFVQALNEVLDSHSARIVAAFQSRLPAVVWVVLYVVTAVGMAAIGYQAASSGSVRSPTVGGLILSFAMVLWLVACLDRPGEGPLRISQQAMRDLQATMASAP